jgi:protease I
MAQRLNGRKIAALETEGFEQVELTEPVNALKETGAEVEVVAPKSGCI